MSALRDRANGRWRGILSAIGINEKALNGKHCPCPMCGGKDRFRFDDKQGNGTFFCTNCSAGDGVKLVMLFRKVEFKEAAVLIEKHVGAASFIESKKREASTEDQQEALHKLWSRAVDVRHGDPVDRFLSRRGVGLVTYPPSLRLVSRLFYRGDDFESEGFFPAMVAAVQDAAGKPINIHRTYLTLNGEKAKVEVPRKMMPGPLPEGCAIRVSECAGSSLGLAEGIETALAATSLFGIPCWSAVNSTCLSKWLPPPCVTDVVIFGDTDPDFKGQAAAYALAHRLATKGLKVDVRLPDVVGEDWNDVLLKRQKGRRLNIFKNRQACSGGPT